MLEALAQMLALLQAVAFDRTRLAVENVALRQQLVVLQRGVKRARIEDGDRIFWILMRRMIKDWAEHLVIVRPETVIRWHRKGFAFYWRRKSKAPAGGRPPLAPEVIDLIRRMSTENVLWGSPRIRRELLMLGLDVAKSTIETYMIKRPTDEGTRQRWRTFIRNHMDVTAACDFFTVPTLTFKVLYVFVVLSHSRRRILHVNVTPHPTAEWAANQITEAFPDGIEPRYLHRDRDAIYGAAFRRRVKAFGIKEVISAPKSPWQNPYVERVIGTIRRECTDHIIALGELHLVRILRAYVETYYNPARCHGSLDGDAPFHRPIERHGEVVATPILGGLHHRYGRRAA